jgi:EAL domain-containing protein (putative c-di-GMP-specific phosphodiesterase class I)
MNAHDSAAQRSPVDRARIGAAADGIGIAPAFQPIVSLPDGAIVGFEALARWPFLNNPHPEAVFRHANDNGHLDQLDQICIDAAVELALRDELSPGTLLLINCEPTSTYVGPDADAMLARGRDEFQMMFEFTERSLLAHPRALLRKIAAIRADGFAVALDDVGAHPDSLALLDIVCPDVIKLDMALVQSDPTIDQARTLTAVMAHHERTGAAILAEGIETHQHLEQALAMGATLGQGYRFGRARSLRNGGATAPWRPAPRPDIANVVPGSPYELVAATSPVRTARKSTLMAFSHHIERQAGHAADPPMVMAAVQRLEHFTPATRRRYVELAATSPMVAVFGENLPDDLGHGVRGVPLDPSDPLCAEWTVLTLGPHTAAALIARERTDIPAESDADRRFDLAITYDRTLVTVAARNMLERIR